MSIPLPDQGHWNKVKAGKKVKAKPFIEKAGREQQFKLSLRIEEENANEEGLSPQLALQRSIEADASIDLAVKDSLIDPDPLVLKARQAFLSKKEFYDQDDLRSIRPPNLRISVSPGYVDRSLRIMDTFIKAMRSRGHDFVYKDGSYRAVVSGQAIEMTLKETQTRVATTGQGQSSFYKATGSLVFRFEEGYISTSCKDGKEQKIEQQLSKLISRLELMGERLTKEQEEREERWAKMAEKERIRKEREQRKKLEVKSFQQLARDASRWKECQMIREYIDQKERNALAENDSSEEIMAWLEWARKKVDWYDPMVALEDEWLADTTSETIMHQNDSMENAGSSSTQQISYGKTKGEWPLKPWYVK